MLKYLVPFLYNNLWNLWIDASCFQPRENRLSVESSGQWRRTGRASYGCQATLK